MKTAYRATSFFSFSPHNAIFTHPLSPLPRLLKAAQRQSLFEFISSGIRLSQSLSLASLRNGPTIQFADETTYGRLCLDTMNASLADWKLMSP